MSAGTQDDAFETAPMTISSLVQLTETGVRQSIDFAGDVRTRVVNVVQEQLDEGVRLKLIALGWTPPGATPLNIALRALVSEWEARAQSAFPADAMLINRHTREVRSVLIRAEEISAPPAVLNMEKAQ